MNAAWLLLAGAIAAEVIGTLSLRMAAHGTRVWYALVLTGYASSYAMLVQALALGMPLGMAYGIWTAVGVAATAILSRLLWGEPLTWLMGAGIALIIGGVLLIEMGAVH